MAKKIFFFFLTWEIPSGQDEAHLARSVGQSELRIRFTLPTHGSSHIKKAVYSCVQQSTPLSV